MTLLSDLKLGVNCDIIKGVDIMDIIALMINIHPASLQKLSGEIMNSEERDIKRAALIREKLKNLY